MAQSRTHVTVEDARDTPRFGREDPVLRNGMISAVAVLMFAHGGNLNGVLAGLRQRPPDLADDETQALAALAATAAAAFSSTEPYTRVAEKKERSEAILANIADGIVADREDAAVLWNATAEQITGVPAEEALGRRVADVLQRELRLGRRPAPRRAPGDLPARRQGGLDLVDRGRDGRRRRSRRRSHLRFPRHLDGARRRADEVRLRRHRLARAPHAAHLDLRLRRNAPCGDVEFSDPERGTFLSYIASESERLISIVDDLLNVARLETGTVGLNMSQTDLGDVVSETVSRFAEQLNGDFTLDVEVPRDRSTGWRIGKSSHRSS